MKGYRTIILNVIVAVLGVLVATDWTSVTSTATAGLIVAGLGIANTVLRCFTSTPVGSSAPTAVDPNGPAG